MIDGVPFAGVPFDRVCHRIKIVERLVHKNAATGVVWYVHPTSDKFDPFFWQEGL